MQDLKITTLQSSLHWEEPEKNLEHFDRQLEAITDTDLIILPEMFTTGFTMKPELLAEKAHSGQGLQWMKRKAAEKQCVVTGSISVKDQGHYYNRLYWATPGGTVLHYDKRHLFSMGREHRHYSSGDRRLLIAYKGWKICPLICYDLRFPVWSRNSREETYDLLIYVANWPEVRSYPWRQLLVARAIENQCYVAGVNRIGEDGNGIPHSGDTQVLNARGELISESRPHEARAETLLLPYAPLAEFRKAFPVLDDADRFSIA